MNIADAVKSMENQFLDKYNTVDGDDKKIIVDIYKPRLNVYKTHLSKITKEILYDNHKR